MSIEMTISAGELISIILLLIGLGPLLHRVSRWSGIIDAVRNNFKESVEKSERKLDDILFLMLSGEVIKRDSPLMLTDFGEEISRDFDALAWADRIAPDLKIYTDALREDCKI